MMKSLPIASCLLALLLAGCANQMTEYSGGKETVYSQFYDAGAWLDEGKLGFHIVVDHGNRPNSNIVAALCPMTLYLVNLEERPRRLEGVTLKVVDGPKVADDRSIVAHARARTKTSMGSALLSDYGTEVKVEFSYRLDGGPPVTTRLTIPRVKVSDLPAWGKGGRPPYPWFKEPYYPLPPLQFFD